MKTLKKGILIAIEGIDGSGKSTLAQNLSTKLKKSDIGCILTREPGATPLGTIIRNLLHEKPVSMCPKAEYLLFAADRAQHMAEIIEPALQEHKIVLSDRMGDSSVVYQGYARGLDIPMIQQINKWAMNNTTPDLIFYVQLSVDEAINRIIKRNEALTSFEKEGRDFLQKLVNGFNTLYTDRKDVITLDGNNTPAQLTEQAFDTIVTRVKTHCSKQR